MFNATGQRALEVAVTGTRRSPGVWTNTTGAITTMLSLSGTLYLTAGDYLEMYVWQNSGGALNTASGSSENQGYFSARLVST